MTLRWDPEHANDYRSCVRCGCRYTPRNRIAGLCRDCRLVLDPVEQPRWLS